MGLWSSGGVVSVQAYVPMLTLRLTQWTPKPRQSLPQSSSSSMWVTTTLMGQTALS